MKRFFIRLGIFALIMIVCDFVIGAIGGKLVEISKGGDIGRMNHIANMTDEDVLIFGSSRANHHYDPIILEDILGMSAYNCGFDGNGIICAYGFYKILNNSYCPKVLIYDIANNFDLKNGDDHKYLKHLRYFYDKGIDSIYWDVDKNERYKMMSKMYRYNSVFPQLIMNNLHPFKSYNKGYLPLHKKMSSKLKPLENLDNFEYDSLKLRYIEKLIDDCEGKTQLIFTVSPLYENTEDKVLDPIKMVCEKKRIPLLSHYTDSAFNCRSEYFSDRNHLNLQGATEYSKVIAEEIKQLMEQQR